MNSHSQDSKQSRPCQPQFKNKNNWDDRKSLLIKINPRVEALFAKVDLDYLQLFHELSDFKELEGHDAEASKKLFFQKHCERILVHFFQYLFDFQLQTLQFTDKNQTILSFADWIENQVTFESPDTIRLLNKKRFEQKVKISQEKVVVTKISSEKVTKEQSKGKKRSFKQGQQKTELKNVQSPKKKKVVQKDDRMCFVEFSKQEDSTSNTLNATPKQDSQEKEKVHNQKQGDLKKAFIEDGNDVPKRKYFKVSKLTINGKVQPQKQNLKKKQGYQLKSNYLEKNREPTLILQKSKNQQNPNKKSGGQNIQVNNNKVSQISKGSTQQQPIVLQDLEKSEEKESSIAEGLEYGSKGIENLSGKDLDIFSDTQARSCISNQVGSVTSRDQFPTFEQSTFKQGPNIQKPKMKSESRKNSCNKNISNEERMGSLKYVQGQILTDKKFESEDEMDVMKERKNIKLYNLRVKLSGVLHYSEKRFYIFPDMANDDTEQPSPVIPKKTPNIVKQKSKSSKKSKLQGSKETQF